MLKKNRHGGAAGLLESWGGGLGGARVYEHGERLGKRRALRFAYMRIILSA